MTPNARLYFLLTRSPLHVGCGTSLGFIDKPTLRNVVTRVPMVPGSSVKGCIKEPARRWSALRGESHDPALCEQSLFGREGADGTGMLCPQDAHLLLLPVASWAGGWGWATCPAVLHRLRRAAHSCGLGAPKVVPALPSTEHALLLNGQSPLIWQHAGGRCLMLAEQLLVAEPETAPAALEAWADWLLPMALAGDDADWRAAVRQRLALVSNEVFDWLCEVATDVRARNKIGDDGLAEDKKLWREECVPEDALFYGLLSAQTVRANPAGLSELQALDAPERCELQLGGKASIGYGWCRFEPVPRPGPGPTHSAELADAVAAKELP